MCGWIRAAAPGAHRTGWCKAGMGGSWGMDKEIVVASEEFEVENAGVVLCGTRSSAAGAAAADQIDAVLMIHGACVDRSFFAVAACELARRFDVLIYDRRGYSESALPTDGSEDVDCSVAVQAEDAAAIIRALGGGAPMHVVAHSGGCTIALELAARHPELVRRVILDEPLFIDCLPAGTAFEKNTQRIHGALEEGNLSLALHLFMPTIGASDPRSRSEHETPIDLFRANTDYFIRCEYVPMSTYVPDYGALRDADLRVLSSELDHGEQYPQCAQELASRVGAPVYYVPGMHNFPTDLPEEFARFVAGALLL